MTSHTASSGRPIDCDRPTSVTRALLAYGALAGPFYVVTALAQALTRDGFDLTRHQWSLLSNGGPGWIQIANFTLTGLMTIAFAAGLRRATLRAAAWLIGVYGVSLLGAGAFRADPALGFPAGAPDTVAQVSWHGMLHFVCGGVGFACLIAACLVVGHRFAREGRAGWAAFSRATGVLFLAGFAAVASGAGATWTNLAFTASVVLAWAWMSALAIHLYRRPAPRPVA
ncbi:DUF998 domain-containing protein [Sphaerisporangium aureirubrum]|uniref:DUF998 domain-containing protein n=1 Tax=Sphaerisporangium aureirubrum TaxID=1544736 RepID=A0ABW1NJA2_9ACTN